MSQPGRKKKSTKKTGTKKKTGSTSKPVTEVKAARDRAPSSEPASSWDRTVPIALGVVAAIAIGAWGWASYGDGGTRGVADDEQSQDEADTAEPESDDPLATPRDVSGPPAGAPGSASGLHWRILREGTGTRHPRASDRVRVHYAGWRAEDGELFDSSYGRGRPAEFPLGGVIPGWTEVVQLMVEGEKRRVWIPANLAYEGRPGPQGMLVFDIELLAIL